MPLIQKQEKKPSFEPKTENDQIKSQVKDFIWETLKVIIISLAIIIPVRYFIIQPFYVKGASMEPNFYDHEYLIIDEISYRFSEPNRGDVIVFRYPYDKSQFFIKRIIGLPSESLNISGGEITITTADGAQKFVLVEDGYLPNTFTQGGEEIKLAEDEYYIMGDNRDASLDSRMFGPISKSDIVGRVWVRGWPLGRLEVFDEELY